jgi:hypothetical protein
MSYAADDTLANTASFQTQVRCSIVKAAVNIASEARTTHPNIDQKRENLANRVLNNPTSFVVPFSYACIEASALAGTPTDAQVDTAVATAWNGMAGVLSSD